MYLRLTPLFNKDANYATSGKKVTYYSNTEFVIHESLFPQENFLSRATLSDDETFFIGGTKTRHFTGSTRHIKTLCPNIAVTRDYQYLCAKEIKELFLPDDAKITKNVCHESQLGLMILKTLPDDVKVIVEWVM